MTDQAGEWVALHHAFASVGACFRGVEQVASPKCLRGPHGLLVCGSRRLPANQAGWDAAPPPATPPSTAP